MTTLAGAMAAYGQARRTKPPITLVVDVYDSILTLVARAKAARHQNKRDQEFSSMSLATRMLAAMEGCLNHRDDRTRALSGTLSGYYKQTIMQLHAAAQTRGAGGVDRYASVYRQIVSMRDAWAVVAGVPPLSVPALQQKKVGSQKNEAQGSAINA